MIWLILIFLFIALIYSIKLLIFAFKEDIKANAWADAEIKVRQQVDNLNVNIKENNSKNAD